MTLASGRDRSLGGCGTCRSRHTKCDETRPVCNVCLLSNLTCTGYDIRLRFVYQGQKDAGDSEPQSLRFRRPLYTESQRKDMNESLIQSFRGIDPNQALLEIDEQAATLDSPDYPMSRGPFGVFQVHSPLPRDSPSDDVEETFKLVDDDCFVNGNMGPVLTVPEGPLDLLDPLPLDFSLSGDINNTTLLHDDTISFANSLLLPDSNTNNFTYSDYRDPLRTNLNDAFGLVPTLYHPIQQTTPLPDNSWLLLANYRDRVIPLLAPLNTTRKSPWHHIIFPCAMGTMAELTMGGSISYARSALLYTLLATSATHIQLSCSQSAGELSFLPVNYLKQRARHDLRSCLEGEMSMSSKSAKYKDVLMALISMAILNVFEDDADSLLACLLLTEEFIKRKGLIKATLSRKVRLLHHCYAYLRIINESIILSDMSNDPFQQLGIIPDPTASSKSPRFRISQWTDTSDFATTKVKSIQLGQRDLHLEHPGRWDLTMYPEIFGIPESLLYLISHATRLGNERDLIINGKPGEPSPNPRDFLLRAKALEKHISRWDPRQGLEGYSSSTTMVLAIQQALLIFFYRRFHDIEASMLQEKVRQVKDLLHSSRTSDQNVHLIWPGFIAACEALSADLQDYFRGWFQDCFRQTGLPSFQVAGSIAESIWSSGDDENGRSLQWPEIVRSNRRLVIF